MLLALYGLLSGGNLPQPSTDPNDIIYASKRKNIPASERKNTYASKRKNIQAS